MSEKKVQHPMEEVFDLEPGSTLLPAESHNASTELTTVEAYDTKDNEIEKQFQEVYDVAMDAFEQQQTASHLVEPKFRARSEEVAVQYLNTALAAAKEKMSLKQQKEKLLVAQQKSQTPGTVNQNLIVADRNELLKTLFQQKDVNTNIEENNTDETDDGNQ